MMHLLVLESHHPGQLCGEVQSSCENLQVLMVF